MTSGARPTRSTTRPPATSTGAASATCQRMTVAEYRAKGSVGRGLYRLVRHPLFLFGVVPFYSFFLQNRLPVGLMRSGWKYWLSAMATNAAIAAVLTGLAWFGGWQSACLRVPSHDASRGDDRYVVLLRPAPVRGHTSWSREDEWDITDAALAGSSHYDLPPILRWITGNIGVHHVHHLASRIPFYRLPRSPSRPRGACADVPPDVAREPALRAPRPLGREETKARYIRRSAAVAGLNRWRACPANP
jgi:fatty acid desaturase